MIDKNKEKHFYIILGRIIRKIREESKYSLEKFSEVTELGLDKSTMSTIENGKQRLSLYQLYLISKAIDVPVSKIILDIEDVIKNSEEEDNLKLSEKDKFKIDNI
jgi:transcriptional regulator with XRE-family HTH domain